MFNNSLADQETSEELLNKLDGCDSFTHRIHDIFNAKVSCASNKLQLLILELIRILVFNRLALWDFHFDSDVSPMQEKPIAG